MNEHAVKENIVANFSGKAWVSLMGLICIPLYIKFMGIEGYGLVGIFISLSMLLSIMDMGLSSTASRELARLSVSSDTEQEACDLVRTLEYVYWGMGLLISILVMLLAPLITHHWIKSQDLPASTVQQAIMIMGIVIAFQWPASLYDGGLMGLQRQVKLNGIRSIMATVQHGGAVLILWLISPSILAFLYWQVAVSLFQTVLLSRALRNSLPRTNTRSFHLSLLHKNWKYAAGMTGISVMTIILTQLDKILLSRLLSLVHFGYYVLAANVAGMLHHLVSPIFSAYFPNFTQMVIQNRQVELVDQYHRASQLLSIVVLPVAVTMAFFSRDLLSFWLHDLTTVNNTYLLVTLLLIANTLTSLMHIPYALQLAYGWTHLTFYYNTIASIVIVPFMYFMVSRYGVYGAPLVLIVIYCGYLFILMPAMHRRLLPTELFAWYLYDIGKPLITILLVVFCSYLLMPVFASPALILMWVMATYIASLFLSSLTTPLTRAIIRKSLAL